MLNKCPVLDKGWVALLGGSPMRDSFKQILKTHFRGVIDNRITDMTHVMMSIKCPLFIQMTFSEHGLTCVAQKTNDTIEAYIPDVSAIGSPDLEINQQIQQDIKATTEALLINPKAYQADRCDIFISQVISPISIYNTLTVYGPLTAWISYINQKSLPKTIEAYRKTIEENIFTEWDLVAKSVREERNAQKNR